MSSDSDRTIDSDELEALVSKSKRVAKTSPKKSKQKASTSKVDNAVHNISDSESEEETPKRQKVKHDPKCKEQSQKPICKYGKSCYRKNPDHVRNFYHGGDVTTNVQEKVIKQDSSLPFQSLCKNEFLFYLTKVHGIDGKYNASALNIKDILSFEDGQLISSAQFNYMHDIPWLINQYPEKYRTFPLTIVHGEQREAKRSLEKTANAFKNVKLCQAKLDIPYGTHHTKMMFLLYKEGFRVVIHTSNLCEGDWFQKTQGMWVSPVLKPLTGGSTGGESPTNFKADLLEYVSAYGAPELDEWCQVIRNHDFSGIRVVLIGSVPGRHIGSRKTTFGHLKLRKILNQHCGSRDQVDTSWPVIGQFSSIGSLGSSPDQWLTGEFSTSLLTVKDAALGSQHVPLKLVYPTVENVRKSLEGYPAGGSLPYSIKVAEKQLYLKKFLHQWKSEKLGRSEASPHIKTYLRVSPSCSKIGWFLVTSSNLSKAAWGCLEKKGSQFMIRSYELGVLFLPKFFDVEFFNSPAAVKCESAVFPVPFDLPLEPYSVCDDPWIWDIPQIKGPDRYGNKWCPPLK